MIKVFSIVLMAFVVFFAQTVLAAPADDFVLNKYPAFVWDDTTPAFYASLTP